MDQLDQVSTNLTNLLASHVFPGQLYAAKFTADDGMYRTIFTGGQETGGGGGPPDGGGGVMLREEESH